MTTISTHTAARVYEVTNNEKINPASIKTLGVSIISIKKILTRYKDCSTRWLPRHQKGI